METDELLERARARMVENKADIMVANDLRDVSSKGTKALLIKKSGVLSIDGTKKILAEKYLMRSKR